MTAVAALPVALADPQGIAHVVNEAAPAALCGVPRRVLQDLALADAPCPLCPACADRLDAGFTA